MLPSYYVHTGFSGHIAFILCTRCICKVLLPSYEVHTAYTGRVPFIICTHCIRRPCCHYTDIPNLLCLICFQCTDQSHSASLILAIVQCNLQLHIVSYANAARWIVTHCYIQSHIVPDSYLVQWHIKFNNNIIIINNILCLIHIQCILQPHLFPPYNCMQSFIVSCVYSVHSATTHCISFTFSATCSYPRYLIHIQSHKVSHSMLYI